MFSLRAIKTCERESIHLVYNIIMTSERRGERHKAGFLVYITCVVQKRKKRSPTINTEDISKPHPVGARRSRTTPYALSFKGTLIDANNMAFGDIWRVRCCCFCCFVSVQQSGLDSSLFGRLVAFLVRVR